MSFKYGSTSEERLATCHPDLQLLARAALKTSLMDMTIICGHRNERDQMSAYTSGNSKLKFPESKHNQTPSLAIDIAPWFSGIDWEYRPHFDFIAGHVFLTAKALDIGIRWGGDWNQDGNLKNNSFNDLVHYELVL